MLFFVFPFTSITVLRMFSNTIDLFYMYDIRVMTGDIGLPIRKLLENTLLYPIIGQTKTMKLLLTRLKTKHNVIVLRHHIIQFFTRKKW